MKRLLQPNKHLSFFVLSRFVCIALCLFGLGCATVRRPEEYPLRKVNRPITLPKGMTEAIGTLPWQYAKNSKTYDLSQPYPFYIHWNHALSDDLSLIWFILPLGFKYRLLHEKNQSLSMEFLGHIGSTDNPNLSPYLTVIDRCQISSDVEIETRVGLQWSFQFKRGGIDWASNLQTGPRFQILDQLSFRPWFALLREFNPEQNTWSIPLGGNLSWSVVRQLDLELNLVQTTFGTRSIPDTTASLQIIHFW